MRGSGGSTFSLAYDGGSGTTPTLAQVSKIYSGTFSFDNNHNGVVTNYGSRLDLAGISSATNHGIGFR